MDDDLDHRLHAWVDAYVRAWNSNDPAAIAGLFTPDAAYHTEPYRPPWRGRDEIVRRWLGRKDEPGETEFRVHRVVDAASRPHRLTGPIERTKVGGARTPRSARWRWPSTAPPP